MTVRMFATTLAQQFDNNFGVVQVPPPPAPAQRVYGAGPLPAPQLGTLVAVASGGTFAAGTYFYKVTAINGSGETVASNEQQVTLVLNGSATISWSPVLHATGYRVYRGTASNGEGTYYTVTGATTFTDTNAAGTGGTPPGATTAVPVLDVPGSMDGSASGDAAALVNAGYVAIGLSGATTQRPPSSGLKPGIVYVDSTLAIVVVWDGTNWRNVVTGAIA